MMNNIKFSLTLLFQFLVLMVYSQSASFTVNKQDGCAPLSGVVFTNTSTGATSYSWDFGDGTGSGLTSPTHSFANPGSYDVTLTANNGGSSDSYTLTITVFNIPTASFTTSDDTSGCVPLLVNFEDQSVGNGSNIVGYEWSFGDGGSSTTGPNTSYSFSLAGSFNVSLIVTDGNGCKNTSVHTNMINTSQLPTILFSSDPSPIAACTAPLNVNILSNSSLNNSEDPSQPLTFTWDFGNGQTFEEDTPSGITYDTTGTYNMVVTATDQNGCTNTYNNQVTIANPLADFFTEDTVCLNTTFINNSTPGTYWWTYGDNTSGNSTNHTFPAEGFYDVTLTVTNGSCSHDTTHTVFAEDIVADFSYSPLLGCEFPFDVTLTPNTPNAASWSWAIGDSIFMDGFWALGDTVISSSLENPTLSIPDPDSLFYLDNDSSVYDIILTVTSSHGCQDQMAVPSAFFVYPPTARFMPDDENGCAPFIIAFSDSSIENHNNLISWEWDMGDGTTFTNADGSTVTHTYNTEGVYPVTLIVTDDVGCVDTSFAINIEVGETATPNFSLSTVQACPYDPINFTDLTPAADSAEVWHFETDLMQLSHCLDDNNPVYGYDSYAGFHDVTLTTAYNGCYSSYTVNNAIEILGPIGRFDIDYDCATPFDIDLTALNTGVDRFVWDFGDGTLDSNQVNISHSYAATGDYTITLTSYNNTSGCAPFVYSREVKIRNIQAGFTTDSVVCIGTDIPFNASASQDVDETCKYGYLWIYENEPPEHFSTPNPTHAFSTAGPQNLTLVVTDINGCTDTSYSSLIVSEIYAGFFTDTTFGCLPATFEFTDTSYSDTSIVNWNWTFGSAGLATDTNPTFTFPLGTTSPQTVSLEITDALGCTDSVGLDFTFGTVSNNFFALTSRNICAGDSVTLYSPSANDSYTWVIGDGVNNDTIADDNIYYHTFDTAGTYTISLIVVNSSGCSSTYTRNNYVIVQDYPQAGYTTDADNLNNCAPLQLTFIDTSYGNITVWDWDLGTGDPVISASEITQTYTDPGEYYISLEVSTSFGCSDSIINDVLTVAGPRADFTLNPDTICKGDAITFEITDSSDVFTYLWDFGDGTDSSHVSPVTHTYDYAPAGGETAATLIYWSDDSLCYNAVTYPVYIREVFANFLRNGEYTKPDTANCSPFQVTFTDSSTNALNWYWDFGVDGLTSTSPGEYEIMLAVDNSNIGCSDTIRKTIIVFDDPNITTTPDSLVCEGDQIDIQAFGATLYTWDPTDDILLNQDSIISVLANQTTNYTITGVDTNGCVGATNYQLDVINQLNDFSFDTTIIIGQTVDLFTGLNNYYEVIWTPSTWLTCDSCNNTIAQPEENMVYAVYIRDSLGCFEYLFDYEIEVLPLFSVDAPTAFTPNGDGTNDVFMVNGWGIRSLNYLRIYNRFGEMIFESTDLSNGWNGYYKGQLQNMETYTFQASVLWYDDNVGELSGTFKLIK